MGSGGEFIPVDGFFPASGQKDIATRLCASLVILPPPHPTEKTSFWSFLEGLKVLFQSSLDVGHVEVLRNVHPSAGAQDDAQDGGGSEPGHDVARHEALQERRLQQTATLAHHR